MMVVKNPVAGEWSKIEDHAELPIGTRVEKIKGYRWPGLVVAAFKTTTGQQRYVVECTAPEVQGALHIYSPDQIARAMTQQDKRAKVKRGKRVVTT